MAAHASMAEALRLTRSGNLTEATKLLQAALGPGPMLDTAEMGSAGDVITLVAQPVPSEAPPSSVPTAKTAPHFREIETKGHFEERVYRGAQGSMSYWLYRPLNTVVNAPLIVMLHGCTQSPQDFARGTGMNGIADELGFLVAYPQQSAAANPQKCWNWFRPGDQRRDHGEPAQLAGLTREIIAEHNVDPGRVYIAGLSAGGAAAAIMADQYPDIYAAVGIHSGLGCGAARDLPSALSAMKRGRGAAPAGRGRRPFVPVITIHGNRDSTVNEVNSGQIVAAATAASAEELTVRVEKGTSPAGRSYTRAQSVDSRGDTLIEQWTIEGSGHAWSGGNSKGSYTDPSGPSASRAMISFFRGKSRGSSAAE